MKTKITPITAWTAVAIVAALALLPLAAYAGAAGGGSCEQGGGGGGATMLIDFSGLCAPVNDLVKFVLGPFAKGVVAMTVISAVTVLAESRDIPRGFAAIVPWLVVVAMISGTATMFNALGAGI